jgi:uncharacterized glyoxalase superfamily protein PhnB
MVKFGYTILYVRDVEKSIAFYEKAFGFTRKFIIQNEYGELITGETTLSFASLETANGNLSDGFIESHPGNKPFGIEIGLTTENVQEVYDNAIAAGAVPEAAPQFKPHGQTVSYVRDLDGFLVEICTPMG